MPEIELIHDIERGEWIDHLITVAQVVVAIVVLLGIIGWLTVNPFLLLSFIFSQPLIVIGLILFIVAAIFFERPMVREEFDAGEVVFEQGTPSYSIYLVKSGRVDLVAKNAKGEEKTVASFGPGRYVGFAALIKGAPHKFTAKAQVASTVVRIRPTEFIELFSEIPELKAQVPVLEREINEALEQFAPELIGTPSPFREK
jgi:hypothetical protein